MRNRLLIALLGTAGLSVQAAAVDVRLLDSRTGTPIANAEVRVSSDNGIRCVRAPCPTDFKEWTGRSDSSGNLSVPATAFNADTRFQATGYEPTADLPREAAKAANWQVELDPKGSDMERGMRVDRVKLIDKASGKPLAGVLFWVATGRNCRSGTCADVVLSGSTNVLGNAFVPLAGIPNLEQRLWIGVEGHESVEYGRDPTIALPRR